MKLLALVVAVALATTCIAAEAHINVRKPLAEDKGSVAAKTQEVEETHTAKRRATATIDTEDDESRKAVDDDAYYRNLIREAFEAASNANATFLESGLTFADLHERQ